MMLFSLQSVSAQRSKGIPVFFQNFGKTTGTAIVAAPPLPAGKTELTNSNAVCPADGSYTIVRAVNPSGECFNNEWIPLSSDYTSDYDTSMSQGNMMLVNHATHAASLTVYSDTIKASLCTGTDYIFSAALINVDRNVTCNSGNDFPDFVFNVESANGQVLFTDTTGGIGFANPVFGYKFSVYGLTFKAPAGHSKLVIRIKVLPSAALCGEDFAIDDILVSADGPDVNINFNNEPSTFLVKSVCFQDAKTITLTGSMNPFYTTPALQWQQSTDDGFTWVDIAGATSAQYTQTFTQADTFLFRLTGAEAVNMANLACRVISRNLKVEVDGLPQNYKAVNNSPVCAGAQMQLNAHGGARYIWNGPNSFYDDIANPQIFFSALKDSGMYYVDIFSFGGCRVKDSTYVTMIGTDVKAIADTAVCKGEKIKLDVTEAVSYNWSPPNGLSNTVIKNPTASPDATTTYTVKVTDKFGCSDTAQITLTIKNKEAVKAVMNVIPYLCRGYDSLQFEDNSTGVLKYWYWDFGNGQTSISQKTETQYYSIPSGVNEMEAMLAVADDTGCTDTTYQTLRVINNCYIAVPNAFTPNSDGLNDLLSPLNAYKATNLIFRVFNRNGKLIFETTDFTKGWDGAVKGIAQDSGTYVWMLEFNDTSGRRIKQKGATLLIR
jgi:gliding motility-associated-like protein